MMNLDNLDSPLLSVQEGKFRRAVRKQNRFVNFLAILGVPTVVGVWLSVSSADQVGNIAFWGVTGLLVLLQIILYFVTTTYAETVPELHLERAELQEIQEHLTSAVEDSDRYIEWLEKAAKIGTFWTTFQGLISAVSPESDEEFGEACRLALSPMIDAAGVLFDFSFGEVWSIAVYRLNDKGDLLEPVWWKRAEDHPSEGAPRTWRPGDGHVGSAFMQDRILYTTDMTSDDASMLLKPSVSNNQPYDNDVYRSFVSAPILLDLQPEPMRYGVLVITSSEIGRFDDENKSIVSQAAQVIAHLFDWRRLAIARGKA